MKHAERMVEIERLHKQVIESIYVCDQRNDVTYLLDRLTAADSLRDDLLAAAKIGLGYMERLSDRQVNAYAEIVRKAIAKAEKAE